MRANADHHGKDDANDAGINDFGSEPNLVDSSGAFGFENNDSSFPLSILLALQLLENVLP